MRESLIFCDYCGAANQSTVPCCFACGRTLSVVVEAPTTQMHLHGGRYRIVDTLGQGGYGAVYKAIDIRQNNQPVALKSVNLRGLKTSEIIEATETFNRELLLLSELSHPNLPRLRENFSDPEHWYLVMDFIDGQTLEDYLQIRGGKLSLHEVVTIGMDLCAVLNYLHTRLPPVIFRDIKPSNIMRSQIGHIFLIDFGIARRFRPGLRHDTSRLGSPGYAAPEQYGQSQTSPQTDIYCLGITLWQLLSGQDPASTPISRETIAHSTLQPALSPELKDLLSQMLHPDAGQRPINIREVRERLRSLGMQGSTGYESLFAYKQAAVFPNTYAPAASPVNSPPLFPLAGGGGQGSQQQYQVPAARSMAQKRRITRRNALLGITGTLAVAGGLFWHYQTTHSTPVIYTGHQSQVMAVAWAPRGGLIASGDQQGLIQVWDASSGETRQTLQSGLVPWGKVNSISWSPDGETLVAGYEKAIAIWHLDQTYPFSTWPQQNGLAAWSPDGKYIAALSQNALSVPSIVVLDAETTIAMYPPFPIQLPLEALAWSPSSEQIAARYGKNQLPIQIWNLPVSSATAPNPGPSDFTILQNITALTWSPDGTLISLGDAHGLVQTFSMADGTVNDQFFVQQAVSALAWAPYSSWGVTAADLSGAITVAIFGNERKVVQLTNQPLWSLSWSPDGQALASGGADTVIRIWQVHT